MYDSGWHVKSIQRDKIVKINAILVVVIVIKIMYKEYHSKRKDGFAE